jgi:hypothetical protein
MFLHYRNIAVIGIKSETNRVLFLSYLLYRVPHEDRKCMVFVNGKLTWRRKIYNSKQLNISDRRAYIEIKLIITDTEKIRYMF